MYNVPYGICAINLLVRYQISSADAINTRDYCIDIDFIFRGEWQD